MNDSNNPLDQFSTNCIIAGRPKPSVSGKTFATVNPATGKILADVAEAQSENVDAAVAAAREAFDNGPWPRLAPAERKVAIQRCHIGKSQY